MHATVVRARRFLHGFAAATSLLAGAVVGLGAEPAPKTHALYMGADVSVQFHGTLYPVVGVQGDALVIAVDGKHVSIPLQKDTVPVKIVNTVKVAPAEVTVADLLADPTYTPANDPRRKYASNVGAAGVSGAELDTAAVNIGGAQRDLAAAMARPSNSVGYQAAVVSSTKALSDASQALDRTAAYGRSELNSAGFQAQELQRELDQKLFDAMEITFAVSSTRPLLHPYVIGIAQVHERDAKPGAYRNWIVAKSLDPVSTKAASVRIFQGGLPMGYTLDSFRLHVYEAGAEVPTTASAKRVPLTPAEAFQFVLLEYLSNHKTDTLPPAPAIALPPPDLSARISAGEYTRTYFVDVNQDGGTGGIWRDRERTDPETDTYVQAALRGAWFKPALEKGRPVAGVCALKLVQLVRP